jgi:hypothetical protein
MTVVSVFAGREYLGEYGAEYYTTGIDTIRHNEITMYIYKGSCNTVSGYSGLDIISGGDTISIASCAVYFYNFRGNTLDSVTSCIYGDINKNGIDDIIFDEYWGGNRCCQLAWVYELSSPPKLLFDVMASSPGIQIQDIDGDSIPEISFSEGSINRWADGAELIYKWNGSTYRLANYKMKKYVI